MFYGGSLIKHLIFDEDIDIDSLIEISKINVNSAIMIDSDKQKEGQDISSNKDSVRVSFENNGGHVWITSGREIENYIPRNLFVEAVKKKHRDLAVNYDILLNEDRYYQRTVLSKTPKKKDIAKVDVAENVISSEQKTDFNRLELGISLDDLIEWIDER